MSAMSLVKKVLFAQNLLYVEPVKFTKIQDLVRKFYETLEKHIFQKFKINSNEESFSIIFSFFKKADQKKAAASSSNDFLERFIEIQNTLLKQKMIERHFSSFAGV